MCKWYLPSKTDNRSSSAQTRIKLKNIANAIRDIKSFSSRYINENRLINKRFEWQTGYGTFSYGQSQISQVKAYIDNQYHHHKKRTFRDEYIALLKAFEIDYDERYLFDWID